MEQRPAVPINCFFQGCYNPAYEEQIRIAKEQCFRYNQLSPNDRAAQQDILRNLLGSMGKGAVSTPPFWCDYGYNIRIGDNFYSNHGMVITDGAAVTFGDSVFVAPIAASLRRSTPLTRRCGKRASKLPSQLPSATTCGLVPMPPYWLALQSAITR